LLKIALKEPRRDLKGINLDSGSYKIKTKCNIQVFIQVTVKAYTTIMDIEYQTQKNDKRFLFIQNSII
jgi:hypothetical protein